MPVFADWIKIFFVLLLDFNKTVKMAIFEFTMEKWSSDPSFGSIKNADCHVLIFLTKK